MMHDGNPCFAERAAAKRKALNRDGLALYSFGLLGSRMTRRSVALCVSLAGGGQAEHQPVFGHGAPCYTDALRAEQGGKVVVAIGGARRL